MGVSNRVPDMMAAFARDRARTQDVADATTAVRQFNARAKAELGTVAWPTIAAALLSKHHWAHIHCQSCGLITEMDLRVKRRDAAQPVCVILSDVQCPRCNGHGRPAIVALWRFPEPMVEDDYASFCASLESAVTSYLNFF